MPLTRRLTLAIPAALSAALVALPARAAAPVPQSPAPAPQKATAATDVEVKYVDDSTMKVQVLDEKLEFATRHGTLLIPVADVRKVEFASRTPPEVASKIALAISNLGSADFNVRERATAELKGYRERAYGPLLKAVKTADPEVGRRAEDAARFIRHSAAAGYLEAREFDVIYTDDAKYTGKLTAAALRIQTFQFGEQQLRLADVRVLKAGTAPSDEAAAAGPAPSNLAAHQNQFGKELAFAVTGAQPGGQAGVWGTDVYTLDSNLAAAAVHAGMVQPGQTAVVRVRISAPPAQFSGSTRNGITSAGYGNYPAGGYEFVQR